MCKSILPGFLIIFILGLLISSCSDSEIDDLKKRINELEAKGPDTVFQEIYRIDTVVTVINQIDTVIQIDTVYIDDIQLHIDTVYIYDPVFFYGLWKFNERKLVIDNIDSSILSMDFLFIDLSEDSIEFRLINNSNSNDQPPFYPPGSHNLIRKHPIIDQYYDGDEFCLLYDYYGIDTVLVRLNFIENKVNSIHMKEILPSNKQVVGPLITGPPPPCSYYPPGQEPPQEEPTYDKVDTTRNYVFHYRLYSVD
jgi:hypothetical protein